MWAAAGFAAAAGVCLTTLFRQRASPAAHLQTHALQIKRREMLKIRSALVATTLLASLAVAHAQPTQQDAHHPDTAAPAPAATQNGPGMDKMMGGDMEKMMPMMMQMMRDMMGGGRGMGSAMPDMGPPMARGTMALQHIEGQIAFYKAELHITDAQAAQWNGFAETLRANAKRLQDAYKTTAQPATGMSSLPDQLTRRRLFLTAQLESLKGTEPAAQALYAVLSPEQKKAADELMADHLRRM